MLNMRGRNYTHGHGVVILTGDLQEISSNAKPPSNIFHTYAIWDTARNLKWHRANLSEQDYVARGAFVRLNGR